jgi:D-galactose 1-dehydrogenase
VLVKPIRIGIVGVGKIARDQHIPAIAANPAFTFAAAASRHAQAGGVPNFHSMAEMLQGVPDLDAVAICTPPQVHYEAAKLALAHSKHVLLEKPPCTSTAQLDHLVRLAKAAGRTLHQTWHSRHAQGVAPARRLLKERTLRHVRVTWKEDVRQWHPGQSWIWEPGGFGVLDPGINALSILTEIIAEPIFAKSASLHIPSNCAAPIAAELEFVTDSGVAITAALDFRHTGTQTWDIELATDSGSMTLSAGGGQLNVGDKPVPRDPGALAGEYGAIYSRFADLIAQERSEVDARPLQLVADIFLVAKQFSVEAFEP